MKIASITFYLIRRCAGLIFICVTVSASAEVKLPALLSDHMVLQAGQPLAIWGWAKPGENVSVEMGGQHLSTRADADGNWRVTLAPLEAGARLKMTVRGENRIVINDVLVGEVWLGSGQSNMGLQVKGANDFEHERATADHPEIRMFTLANQASVTAQENCQGQWQVCRADTVGNFSAALYFFGRDLHQQLQVPVGMINSSWSGTPIQPWISLDVLKAYPGYPALLEHKRQEIAAWPERQKKILAEIKAWEKTDAAARAAGQPEPAKPWNPGPPDSGRFMPGQIYNAMIHPLIRYRIRGVVWYQGEANAGGGEAGAADYTSLLTRMITSWRVDWGIGDFPFYYVQLPNFNNDSWAWFREGQANVLKVPQTGMAVTIDIGEPDNIHPKNKQETGRRLALIALANVYGKNVCFQGPQFLSCETGGAEMTVEFQHTEGGLVARQGAVKGFLLAGADRKWQPADARIAGNTVIVSRPEIPQPQAVRYDWAGNPDGNLYNGQGLPAMPFRSDNW